MRKSSAGFALTAAAGAVVLAAAPALAALTWTVSAGGAITGNAATNIVITDTVTGKQIVCTGSKTSGTLPNGTGLSNPLGSFDPTTTTFTGCTFAGFTMTSVVASGTWTVNGDSYASGVTTGHISGIRVELHTSPSSTCDLILDGPGGVNTGIASGTYKLYSNNTTGVLTLDPKVGMGDKLVVNIVAGCVGLFATGDAITVSGTYLVKNSSGGKPQISSP